MSNSTKNILTKVVVATIIVGYCYQLSLLWRNRK
jgi:hypothetical protein